MATATQRPVSLRVGEFQVESLGVEWPDYFQGYGLGPRSTFHYCAYGIGDTEEEALADCLEMVAQQGFDVDGETEERIRAEYGPADDSETALEALGVEEETDETPFFHVGIKWNCREEERLARVKKLANLEYLHYQDYCPQGPSSRYSGLQEWGYTRRIDPDSKAVSYGDLVKPADCPESAVKYLEALSTDATEEGELYVFLPYASGSDYSGSTVEKANCREFLESYGEEGFVWEAHGGHNTYAVVLGLTGLLECPDDTFDAILGIIEGLEDYPLTPLSTMRRFPLWKRKGPMRRGNRGLLPTSGAPLRRSLTGLTSSGPLIRTCAPSSRRGRRRLTNTGLMRATGRICISALTRLSRVSTWMILPTTRFSTL